MKGDTYLFIYLQNLKDLTTQKLLYMSFAEICECLYICVCEKERQTIMSTNKNTQYQYLPYLDLLPISITYQTVSKSNPVYLSSRVHLLDLTSFNNMR